MTIKWTGRKMSTKLRLPDVTLLSVTSVNVDQTSAVLLHCAEGIEFGAVKMLCSALPTVSDPRVQYIRIPPIDFLGYSRLMIEALNEYVQTRHCLVVQSDGFVLVRLAGTKSSSNTTTLARLGRNMLQSVARAIGD